MNPKVHVEPENSPATLDQKYIWRPFTQMKDWMNQRPIVIVSGSGATLVDDQDRQYLDANSSIWTNIHGHRRPELDQALKNQLELIAHSSPLGLSNVPAPQLAAKLVRANANKADLSMKGPELTRVFFSDDGSTAMEVAIKLSFESTRRQFGVDDPKMISVTNAYHGDTIGATSIGKIDLFHKSFGPMLFPSESVMSPYCYRCPHNQAKPERNDARTWRRCQWECVNEVESAFATQRVKNKKARQSPKTSEEGPASFATFIVEPVMQGAAGMIAQPQGWLRRVVEIVRANGAHWIADEVMTGFGRTGPLFAYQKEGVRPDFLALAKGLTGGYLPMAATLTTDPVFDAFLGEYEEFKTFFHGHSYTANQLGSSVATASMELLETVHQEMHRKKLADWIQRGLQPLWDLPVVGDIRQEGSVVGIELVKDWKTRESFPLEKQAGIRVCARLAELGVLTRPVGNVLVYMPPYCTTEEEVARALEMYSLAIRDELL